MVCSSTRRRVTFLGGIQLSRITKSSSLVFLQDGEFPGLDILFLCNYIPVQGSWRIRFQFGDHSFVSCFDRDNGTAGLHRMRSQEAIVVRSERAASVSPEALRVVSSRGIYGLGISVGFLWKRCTVDLLLRR